MLLQQMFPRRASIESPIEKMKNCLKTGQEGRNLERTLSAVLRGFLILTEMTLSTRCHGETGRLKLYRQTPAKANNKN